MTDEIRMEQEKLAEHLRNLKADEREKQTYGLMCWLQGHEAGYQAGVSAMKGQNNGETAEG